VNSQLWIGLLPLLVFVIIDSTMGLKAALVTAVIVAVGEAIFSYVTFGELDVVTLASFLLVVVLGAVAFFKKNSLVFKFQPVILSLFMGLILLVTYWMGNPLLYAMAIKYKAQFPPEMQQQLEQPMTQAVFIAASHYFGYSLIAHGLVTAWAAIKLSNWWWLAIRGFGFYIFLFIGMMMSLASVIL